MIFLSKSCIKRGSKPHGRQRHWQSSVASQFVITFQFVINYYKLERLCNAIASQFVINYYKLERICTAAASQFVINYYKLARICNAFAFQFAIK